MLDIIEVYIDLIINLAAFLIAYLFTAMIFSNTVLERQTDFVKLADAFGAHGFVASTPEEFEACFKKAVALGGPVIIDTRIDKDEFVLPMLPPGGSIDDIIVKVQK